MGNKAVEIIPYRVYSPDGRLEMSSDERCRYPPETELSLLNAGRRIMLGSHRISKREVLERLKGGGGSK